MEILGIVYIERKLSTNLKSYHLHEKKQARNKGSSENLALSV